MNLEWKPICETCRSRVEIKPPQFPGFDLVLAPERCATHTLARTIWVEDENRDTGGSADD